MASDGGAGAVTVVTGIISSVTVILTLIVTEVFKAADAKRRHKWEQELVRSQQEVKELQLQTTHKAVQDRKEIMENQRQLENKIDVNTKITAHVLKEAANAAGKTVPEVLRETNHALDEMLRNHLSAKENINEERPEDR